MDNAAGSRAGAGDGGGRRLSATQFRDLPSPVPAGFGTVATDGGGLLDGEAALRPGQSIADRYEVRDEVGRGAMGVVYRAFDRQRGADIALKVLHPPLLRDAEARALQAGGLPRRHYQPVKATAAAWR
jgi:hypothetical protein